MNKPMKINLLAMRAGPLAVAAASLLALEGCASGTAAPHTAAPVGEPVDNVVVPNNSGPHQFPLTITTKRNFFPTSARIIASDRNHVTVVITGGPDQAITKEAANSGPHQDH